MAIIKNNKKVIDIYKGQSPVKKAYRGSTTFWSSETSYDIVLEFEDYLEFKVNNVTYTATESPYKAMLADVGVSSPEEITSYSFDSSATNSKLTKVKKLPFTNKIMNTTSMFYNCRFLSEINIDGWDFGVDGNADFMFAYCSSLTDILSGGTTVTSFGDEFSPKSAQGMFGGCTNLVNIPFVYCRAATNTSYMFYNCQKAKTITLPDTLWYVENTNQMFDGCYELETISAQTSKYGVEFGANWNMSISNRWTNAYAMFRNCYALKQLPFMGNSTSFYKLENVSQMLMNCRTITSVRMDSRNADTWSDLKYIDGCFAGCYNLTTIDLTPWDLTSGNITNVSNLFDGDDKLEYVNFGNWNLDNVTEYSSMFNGCSALYSLNFDYTPSCTTYDLMQSALEEAGLTSQVTFNFSTGEPNCGGIPYDIRVTHVIPSSGEYTLRNTDGGNDTWDKYFITSPKYNIAIGLADTMYVNDEPVTFSETYTFNDAGTYEIGYNYDYDGAYTISPDKSFKSISTITKIEFGTDTVDIIADGAYQASTSNGYNCYVSGTCANCTSLTEIVFPDTLVKIEGPVFLGCTSLRSVTIPESVRYIWNNSGNTGGYGVFMKDTNLMEVYVLGDIGQIELGENCIPDGNAGTVYYKSGTYPHDTWHQYLPSWNFMEFDFDNVIDDGGDIGGDSGSTDDGGGI